MNVFFHNECGAELYIDHEEVCEGLCVRCPACMRRGVLYIDGDDGGTYAGVSWRALEPEDLEVMP